MIRHEGKRKDYVKRCILQRRCARIVRGCLIRSSSHNIISAQVIMKPDCVLGLATGSTPIGTYKQLIEWYEKGDLDFGDVTTVNLDEYKGLPR